jgi:uncharacterized protein YndB with AHSA1/START domain
MTTTTLPHVLDRTITIGAPIQTVFRYFTDTPRWAAWWGAGSTIDARRGGRVYIRYANGTEVSGEVVDIAPPDRIVFTYGFASGTPIPAGSSQVTIRLEPASDGTRLTLHHEFAEADASVRDQHVQGWRYQLAVFANVVTDDAHSGAAASVDGWFAAWGIPDASARTAALTAIAHPSLRFHDRFGATESVDDLVPHIGAAQHFMPGMTITRDGDLRHCQGTILANWKAAGPDGQARGGGTNVFILNADGQIVAVTGFWNA